MTKPASICPMCGQKIAEYKHKINKTLVGCLARLNAAGGRSRIDNLGFSYSHFNNFQKLKYFGLAIQTGKNSEWQITNHGIWFLQGRIQIPEYVVTKNANVIHKSSKLVFIDQVKECIAYKIEWKEQARQPNLFDK